MSNIRQRLSATADRLYARFDSVAKAATYKRLVHGAYNPVTGVVGDSYTDAACKAVLEDWRQSEINGTTVKAGDRKALVRGAELGFEPSADDRMVIGSQTWSVMDYAADPAGIIFTVHIRATQ